MSMCRIRQGNPLSPYLYMLCIEKLEHFIEEAVKCGRWSPLFLSIKGPTLSHLFFMDDLFLFCEADRSQASQVNEIISLFCHFSGQKVNKKKSQVFFSLNTPIDLAYIICNDIGMA